MKDLFDNIKEAEDIAKQLDCEGVHTHEVDGVKKYMPCKSMTKYYEKTATDEELTELVDYAGSFNSSKIPPIKNPKLTPKKTMDQTVAATRITNDPLARGFRSFGAYLSSLSESEINEVDFSNAFGWDVVQNKNFIDAVNALINKKGMDEDDAEDRAEEFGKIEGKESEILKEKEGNDVSEDLITKKEDNAEHDVNGEVTPLLLNNIKSLKKYCEKNNISIDKLIELIKNEQGTL